VVRFAVHLDVIVDGKPPLSRGRLGGLRASTVSVFLDGSPVAGPPDSVLLTPHLQIAVTYRPGAARVPATYAFPAGT
jgi:hypothetical protein